MNKDDLKKLRTKFGAKDSAARQAEIDRVLEMNDRMRDAALQHYETAMRHSAEISSARKVLQEVRKRHSGK